MATTSIWAVKGWLGKVVLYIENPDKTDNPKFYRQEELTDVQTQSLSDVIDYAVRAEKTTVIPDDESAMVVRQFISGINCLPSTARDEMLAVKKRFGKEDGVIAYHGYQSFAPGEATPELAHEIGVKLAQRLWGERYQVLVATHLDKENHLHNHFVLNTVAKKTYFPMFSHTSATMLPATMLIIGNSIIHRHKLKRRVLTICGQLRLLNFTPGTFMRNGPS